VAALVGKIDADTATIARRSATIPTRIDFLHRGAEEGRHAGASSATGRSREGRRNRVQLPL